MITDTAVYSQPAQAAPALGGTYQDPVFNNGAGANETILRVTDYFDDNENYARNGWWSKNNTYIATKQTPEISRIWNATTATAVRTIPVSMVNGSFDPTNDDIFIYFSGASFRTLSASTGADNLLKTFGGTLQNLGGSVDFISSDGRYFVVQWGNGTRVWDRQLDVIYTGVINITISAGWIGITPDGNYVVISDAAVGGGGGLGKPRRSYAIDHTLQTLATSGPMFWSLCGDHGDQLSTSNGKNYQVAFACFSIPGIFRVDITLDQEGKTEAQQIASNQLLIDVPFADDDGHISGTPMGANRDWCWVDIESGSTGGGTRKYKNELLRVNLLTLVVERYAHHRSNPAGPPTYYSQPRVQSSWDGTRALWSCNGDGFTGSGAGLYVLELASTPINRSGGSSGYGVRRIGSRRH